jgi:Dolichyl-phosphate-mannose-protein mannosyltransferase
MGMSEAEQSPRSEVIFWIVVFTLFLLTRLPAMAHYLSIDNVNLAFSLERFDPRVHQPQPPGYPLFVVFARLINFFFHDAARTFKIASLLVSGLCLPLAFAVGRRMFGVWAGRAAVLLLMVCPPFWFASLEGPLRPHLALFSLLTAYCCWRCWQGEQSFVIWSAIALGIGSGFRPDLGGYLFPLWLLSAWMGTRSVSAVMRGLGVMAIVVFSWVGGMALAIGGLEELLKLNTNYIVNQSSRQTVARQIGRLVVWNGTAAIAWLWAVPVYLKTRERLSFVSSQAFFILAWLLPGLLFQALVHVEDPGHTLFSIPAICIIGGYFIFVGTRKIPQVRDTFLAGALVLNTLLFLAFFPLPAAGEPTGGWHLLRNAFVFGTFETSLEELRFQDRTSDQTLKELREFTPTDRPSVIVSSDLDPVIWFMNWRILRWYVPNSDIWVMSELQMPRRVQRVRRDRYFEFSQGPVVRVPVPRGGRVIWLMARDGPFHQVLKQVQPALPGGAYLSYTDIAQDAKPFQVMGFDFVPVDGVPH